MKNPSLRRKLLTSMLTTSTSVLLLTGIALISYEFTTYKETTTRNLSTLAQTIAANSAGALAFDDDKVASEILASFRFEPATIGACLFNASGKPYVTWSADSKEYLPKGPATDGVQFADRRIIVVQPVMQAGARIGTLMVEQNLAAMYARVTTYSVVVFLVVSASAAVAFLLSSFFEKRIAQPILSLANTARKVSEKRDFSLRAAETTTDELGLLTRDFNGMLAEVQRSEQKLEQAVADRTAELRQANENLQTFSYTAAHDLRSPLRSIRSFSTAIVEDFGSQMDPRAREYLDRIVRSAEKMQTLLSDLLEYSRITQAELQLEPVSLKAATQTALSLLDDEIQARKANVTVIEPLPPVLGHPATVVLLIQNLVSNALKFVSPGVQPQIRVFAEDSKSDSPEAKVKKALPVREPVAQLDGFPKPAVSSALNPVPPDFLRLSVEDNGIGIGDKDARKLFAAFQRLHNSQDYAGTGLGLAIVRKGAERLGGKVGMESQPGKGSRFWIDLVKA